MDRKELNGKWKGFCQKFVGEKPSGFSAESFVYKAQKGAFPAETLKKVSGSDWVESLSFNGEAAMSLLGPMECNRDEIQNLVDFLKHGSVKMAFGYEIGKSDPLHVVKEASLFAGREIWFIGDVHGDVFAFRSAIAFINSNAKLKPIYVLLGDIFDRNDFSLNVVLDVLRLLRDNPDSVFMIAGNHDDGLSWNENSQRFESTVTPQQFTEYLNAVDDSLIGSLMSEFIKVIKLLPLGLVLPNGLLATHGGVPSRPDRSVKNVWEGLSPQQIKTLIAERRSEFQRNRFVGELSAGSKISPEFSWVEIINFSHAVESAYGVVIRSMLRGHDHCDLCRHEWSSSPFKGNETCSDFEKVQHVLTMTTMTLMDDGEKRMASFLKREVSCPSVARYNDAAPLPQVYTMEFTTDEVRKYCDLLRRHLGRESLGYVEAHLKRLGEDRQEIEEDYNESKEKLERNAPLCDEQKKRVDQLNESLALKENELKAAETELKNLEQCKADCEKALASGKAHLETTQKEVAETQKCLQERNEKIKACDDAIGEYDQNPKDDKIRQNATNAVRDLLNVGDDKREYSPSDLSKMFQKFKTETEELQTRFLNQSEHAEKLKMECTGHETELNTLIEKCSKLGALMSEQDSELARVRDEVRKETQNLNEMQEKISQCERKFKQAENELKGLSRDMELCNVKKELYSSWGSNG